MASKSRSGWFVWLGALLVLFLVIKNLLARLSPRRIIEDALNLKQFKEPEYKRKLLADNSKPDAAINPNYGSQRDKIEEIKAQKGGGFNAKKFEDWYYQSKGMKRPENPIKETPGKIGAVLFDRDTFRKASFFIINNLESGYAHPTNFGKSENANRQASIDASGETMYGIDRKNYAGAMQKKYVSSDAISAYAKFWGIIDAANAREKWPHYWPFAISRAKGAKGFDTPGPYMQLFELVQIFHQEWANYLLNWLIKDVNVRKKIVSDYPLTMQVAYLAWNGSRWFQDAAKLINQNGKRSPKEIFEIIQRFRRDARPEVIKTGYRVINRFTWY